MLIVKGCRAIEFQPSKVYEDFDVVIDKGRIIASGADAAKEFSLKDAKVIDGRGKLLMPGLVCAHHHVYSGLSRGITASIGPTPDFISILQQLWWKLDRALAEEAVYLSSLICSIDAVRCGTTTVVDHHASPGFIEGSLSAVRRGFEQAGMRGITCYEITCRNGGKEEAEQGLQENLLFAREIDAQRRDGSWNGLCEAAIGAHAPFTVDDDAMKMIADAVQASGRGVHIHTAEDSYDVSHSHHHYRKDIIERLDGFGLLNNRSILVHGVHLREDELEMLNLLDSFLIHNARSNMNNHVGYCRGLPVVKHSALGTDGIGADMFEEFKMAWFKHRDAGGSLQPGDYLRMLSNGHELVSRYFQMPFGSLKPGNAADLVISDYDSPTPLTDENIAGHMAFGMGSRDVRTVIINGNIVMENREFPFDLQKIYGEAQKAAQELWDTMDALQVQ